MLRLGEEKLRSSKGCLNPSMNAGEVLLENMDLRLEAFDYLQLPFSIKQGKSYSFLFYLCFVELCEGFRIGTLVEAALDNDVVCFNM